MKDKVISVIVGFFAAVVLLFVFQSASVFIELSILNEIGELTREAEEAVGKSLSYRAFYLTAAFVTAYLSVFIASRVRKTSSPVPPVITMAFVLLLYVSNMMLFRASVLLYVSSIVVVLIGGWVAMLQQKRRVSTGKRGQYPF